MSKKSGVGSSNLSSCLKISSLLSSFPVYIFFGNFIDGPKICSTKLKYIHESFTVLMIMGVTHMRMGSSTQYFPFLFFFLASSSRPLSPKTMAPCIIVPFTEDTCPFIRCRALSALVMKIWSRRFSMPFRV